jgi:hypothetical protein
MGRGDDRVFLLFVGDDRECCVFCVFVFFE